MGDPPEASRRSWRRWNHNCSFNIQLRILTKFYDLIWRNGTIVYALAKPFNSFIWYHIKGISLGLFKCLWEVAWYIFFLRNLWNQTLNSVVNIFTWTQSHLIKMSQTTRKLFRKVVSYSQCVNPGPYTEKLKFHGQIFQSTIKIDNKTVYHWLAGHPGEAHKFGYKLHHFGGKNSELLQGISAIYVPTHNDEFECFKNGDIICINQPLDYFLKSHLNENRLFNYSIEILLKKHLDYGPRKPFDFDCTLYDL